MNTHLGSMVVWQVGLLSLSSRLPGWNLSSYVLPVSMWVPVRVVQCSPTFQKYASGPTG